MGTNITGIGNANAIGFKSRVTGGAYLPPELKDALVGVWSAYGKSNDSTDRNIIKNKIKDRGGDFVISNAAFKLNSGFGKYETELSNTRIWTQSKETTSSPFSSSYNGLSGWLVFANTELTNSADMPSFKIQVKGLLEGQELIYRYYDSNGQSNVYSMGKDGEYTLPADIRTAKPQTTNTSGFQVVKNDTNTITITQIPSFEGAFVTDGINDLITSTKTVQEMLGGSNEITVVSMAHFIKGESNAPEICRINQIRRDTRSIRNSISKIGKSGIFGYTYKNGVTTINNILGDKNDCTAEGNLDGIVAPFSVEGYYYNNNSNPLELCSIAWYWTIIANKVLTTDEINQVIAYFNLDKTLKPDILCNITKQGITNENHADFNDKLIDYSGNGRDIQMNNLAWKGGSGIAAKPFETIKDYAILSDEARQKLTIYNEFSYKVKSNTPNHYWIVQSIIKDNTSYQVTIITDKDCYWINSTSFTNNEGNKESIRKEYPVKANTLTQVTICGLNEFEYPEGIEPTTAVSYVNLEYAGEVTVTFIPSCKGGLLLDGVNDFGKVTGMPIYKDYTVVADREIIDGLVENADGGVALKGSRYLTGAFCFDYKDAAFSFGTPKMIPLDTKRFISYQSKYVSNGISMNIGRATDNDELWIGRLGNDERYSKIAIRFLMSFPYSMSEFLIERQLKKHKLGTLYPDMVEFRPIINSNVLLDSKPTFVIRGTSTHLNAGDYVPENSQIWVSIKMNNIADRITKFTVNGKTIDIPENAYSEVTLQYGFPFVIDKSPQKITMTIEQDENYVKFEPVITSNVEYHKLDFYLNNFEKRINIGDYIPKDAYLRANFYLKNNVDELTVFTFNGVNIGYRRSSVDDTAFNIGQIYNYDSPQEVNITIDEYIRYEDIKQPYPVLLRFKDENGNEVSWGGKFKVGSNITRIGSIADPESNLLNGLYSVSGLSLNGKAVTSSTSIVEKQMVFKTTTTYLLDNNEPKCILSPSRLRIPNSSYKLLGYIPDISGHGNHGVIHNSAYAEGSGVNEDGSYQFDGVNDFVTIPTLSSGGKQVLMKVNWNTINSIIYDQRGSGGFAIHCSDYINSSDSITVPAYKGRNAAGTTYIDGIRNEYIIASQLRNVTHNIVEILDTSYAAGKTNPIIGKSHMNSNYGNLALYDFMLFDNISTDDKIKELNEYVGIEAKVELPPYYWDAYGKTNFDADRDTIQQRGVAVGDYDITNYNHAYEGMSGYNGYPVVFGANKTWANESNGYVTSITSNTIHITNVLNAGLALLYSYVKYNGNLQNIKEIPSFKIKIKGLEGRSKFIYKYLATSDATKETNLYLGNGTHELPKSFLPTEALINNAVVGFSISPIEEGVTNFLSDITIEVLPEYENGLAYDGVSDFTDNKNIPILTDFTFIIKREILGLETNESMLVIKGDKVYNNGIGNAFILEHNSNGVNYVYSYGKLNQIKRDDSKIIYLTPESYNGNPIIKGENGDNLGLVLSRHWRGIIYKTILYSKTMSLLEINFLKNLMERDEIIDLTNPIFIKNE